MNYADAVGEPLGLVEIVRRDQDRASSRTPIFEQVANAPSDFGVQTGCRFIEQEDVGVVEKRAS